MVRRIHAIFFYGVTTRKERRLKPVVEKVIQSVSCIAAKLDTSAQLRTAKSVAACSRHAALIFPVKVSYFCAPARGAKFMRMDVYVSGCCCVTQ